MRIAVHGETWQERLALRCRIAPMPAFESMGGMALSGVLVASARLGLVEQLARRPADAGELATALSLRPETVRLLLESLHALGYVRLRRGRYRPTRRARRWLLPGSPSSVSHFVASHQDYWAWWSSLSDTARGGAPADHHTRPAADPYWREYITGQYELARFSAPELVRALDVPKGARWVLDVGGGHGWFAAELCRRHPPLRATVVDLPGSVAVGRDIIAGAGYGHLVQHRAQDVRTADLGSGYDMALCLNLVHHLREHEAAALFRRLHAALRPGGTLAVLDLLASPARRRRPTATASCLGLLFHLSSGAAVYTDEQLLAWLTAAGFTTPRRTRLRRIPGQWLYQVTAGD
ncbi:SAM-dependent methyltransferase [Streptomyces sp. CA-250714]|uniref:SAM-dependent methyltransferase n=1 Tax=Streptomyces sp. CA-250714 TaxID=3240060 RepID=UPI003D8B9D63